ncbi:MAG: tetratricopeptide repeat protein [Bacteroidales bacterium]
MNSQNNMPELLPIHPEIENKISKEAVESFQKMIFTPETEITEELVQNIHTLLNTAKEVFGEDNFSEPLNYLAATRHGLREEDLAALLGNDWNKQEFLTLTTCFGFPLVGNMDNILFVPSPHLRGIIFSALSPKEQISFHDDIAFHLLKLPVEDPVRNSESMFHLLQSNRIPEAASFFGKSQDSSLAASADIVGSCFVSGEAGEEVIKALLAYDGEERFDLYRRLINEVFVSLTQNTAPENSEKFISLIEQQIMGVMGEKNTIDNIQLLGLVGLRIASVKLRKNDLDEVKRYFDNSIGLLDRLMAQNPPADAFRWENCDAIFNMGMICLDMRQPKAAEHCFDIAFDILEQKLKTEAEDSERKLYVASWYVTICRVCQQINDKEAGKKYFARGKQLLQYALKTKAAFAAKNPSIVAAQHDLMVMYNDFGDLCHENDLREEAQAAYENALIISERLATNYPEAIEMQILPSVTFDRLGKMNLDLNDLKKAQDNFQLSLDLRKKLAAKYPQDLRLLHDLAGAYHNLAGLYVNAADKSPAEEYLIGQHAALRKVFEAQPTAEPAIISLLDSIFALGDFYFITESWKKALETYEEAQKAIQPLLGKQVSEHVLNRIAGIHYKSGMTQIKLKEDGAGRHNISVASELWKQLSDATKNPLYKEQLDKAQELLNGFN